MGLDATNKWYRAKPNASAGRPIVKDPSVTARVAADARFGMSWLSLNNRKRDIDISARRLA